MYSRIAAQRLVSAVLFAVTIGVLTSRPIQAQTTYSGDAYGAFVNVALVGIDQTFSDTGQLSSSGGSLSSSLASISITGVLSASLLDAKTSGAKGVATSSASLENLNVLNGTITATSLLAKSKATPSGVTGSTTIANLTVGGQVVTVTGTPNQTITVGPLTLIINEQTVTKSGAYRKIEVNALDVQVSGVGQVIIGHAESDITSTYDYVTGLGWILSGDCVNTFQFKAGFLKLGADKPAVTLAFNDYNVGIAVSATSIASYTKVDAHTRTFSGNALINGQAGTYTVTVTDDDSKGAGPPSFSISLNNGYSFSGPVAGGDIELKTNSP